MYIIFLFNYVHGKRPPAFNLSHYLGGTKIDTQYSRKKKAYSIWGPLFKGGIWENKVDWSLYNYITMTKTVKIFVK